MSSGANEWADAQDSTQHLLLFPYLPLTGPLEIGRWRLLPLRDFDGPWTAEWFRLRALDVARRHLDRDGNAVPLPSILVDQTTGADGVLPTDAEIEALAAAVGFGTIDAVPEWRSPLERKAMARYESRIAGKGAAEILRQLDEAAANQHLYAGGAATSDNAEPFFWPINPDGGSRASTARS